MAESKRRKAINQLTDPLKEYQLADAVAILKKAPKTKFDQTVEISMKVNLDQTTNPIRGTVALPYGTGKSVKIAVFCKGEFEKQAKDANADFVGSDELIEKVKGGWAEFDVAVATPDMMKDLAKLGKVLGPRGLMPNPKSGTVTTEIGKAVKELKAGKIEFRMDKLSGIKGPVGKLSFDNKKIEENVRTFIMAILASSPKLQRPHVVKTIAISSTMGPGMKLEKSQFRAKTEG